MTAVITACVCMFVFGAAAAYKAINATAYAKYDRVFSVDEKGIRLFDFNIAF